MNRSIDQKLVESRDESLPSDNEAFVAHTMSAVQARSSSETFQRVLRTTDSNSKETFRMKLKKPFIRMKTLPLFVVVPGLLLGTSAVGATAYVAYQWIIPKVVVKDIQEKNDDNRKQFTVDQQCGNFATGTDLKFELAQYSQLSDDEVYKVFENSCKYDALSAFIDSKWSSDNDAESFAHKKAGDVTNIYEHSNLFAGSVVANPIFGFTIGKITAIENGQLTLTVTLYKVDNSAGSYGHPEINTFDYYPEGKEFTRTLALAADLEVWQDGQQLKAVDLAVGDAVQLVTRAVYELQDSGGQLGLGALLRNEVAAAIKTDIDTRYLTSGFNSGVGDPKIVDQVAALSPCMGFEAYSCAGSGSLAGGAVYGSDLQDDPDRKYLRTDIKEKGLNPRQLQGRIKSIDGKLITLQARGKNDIFTIELPYDVVALHNDKVARGDVTEAMAPAIEAGDLLDVVFMQADDENHLQIKPGDIEFISTIMQTKSDGSRVKY